MTPTLETPRFVILSGCNPRYPVSDAAEALGPDPHGALAEALEAAGLYGHFIETSGRYGGQEEPGYMVEVIDARAFRTLLHLAREFGQECILSVDHGRASFWYVNGPKCIGTLDCGPLHIGPEGDGYSYGPAFEPPTGGDNYSVIHVNDNNGGRYYPLYFAFVVPTED